MHPLSHQFHFELFLSKCSPVFFFFFGAVCGVSLILSENEATQNVNWIELILPITIASNHFPSFFLFCFCNSIGQISITHPLLHPFKYRQRKVSLTTRCLRTSATATVADRSKFQFKKALIVSKLSRYEYEQHKNPKLSVLQLEQLLRDRGTDYDLCLHYHQVHRNFEQKVANSFREFGIDVKLVNRQVTR